MNSRYPGETAYRLGAWRFAVLAMMFLSAAIDSANATVVATITPSQPLADERVQIRVGGLAPNKPIMIASDTVAQDGLHWRSTGVFVSDGRGTINLNTQAPASGSYQGVDAMGLFWSALPGEGPTDANRAFFHIADFSKPIATMLEVREGRVLVASAKLERRYEGPNVARWSMGNGVGVLFAPNDGQAHPGVLVLGGSDPGIGSADVAMLLASHGFAALALAYFGEKGLPATLEGVPMEYFARAIQWMHHQPQVDGRFVAIYGESRGTEPALWTAANLEGVNAVVARSPSFVLWGGVTGNHLPGAAAWTLKGRPLPYIPNKITLGFVLSYIWDSISGTPVGQVNLFNQNLSDFGPTGAVEIPIEKIKGPVLLLAGKDDRIWPSFAMAQRIIARLKGFHHAYPDMLLAYDHVGHPIPYSYIPTSGERQQLRFAVGGTADGTAKAQADAWPRILGFLNAAWATVRARP